MNHSSFVNLRQSQARPGPFPAAHGSLANITSESTAIGVYKICNLWILTTALMWTRLLMGSLGKERRLALGHVVPAGLAAQVNRSLRNSPAWMCSPDTGVLVLPGAFSPWASELGDSTHP